MNYVIAIIQPSKLEDVRDALSKAGVTGLTTSDVQGYGRQKGHTETYRGHEYTINFVRKVRIEVACDSAMLDKVVEAIAQSAKTGAGKIGDGKIFVLNLDEAVRIRTGERNEDAL